jgi:hypothetical protein
LYNKYTESQVFGTPNNGWYYKDVEVVREHFNFGGGLGFEFKISNDFRIVTNVGYGFYNREYLNIYPAGEFSTIYGF